MLYSEEISLILNQRCKRDVAGFKSCSWFIRTEWLHGDSILYEKYDNNCLDTHSTTWSAPSVLSEAMVE